MVDNAEDILFKCIEKYKKIMENDYVYFLDDGTKFKITFKKSNFAHLLGLHKLEDIKMFNLLSSKEGNFKKGQAEIIYRKIEKKQIKYSDITKSTKFSLIEDRIKHFINIDSIIEFSEVIVDFNNEKLKKMTNMTSALKSNIIFLKKKYDNYIHLCIVNKNEQTYPESFFVRKDLNYKKGQIEKRILKIRTQPHKKGNGSKRQKYTKNRNYIKNQEYKKIPQKTAI